MLSSKEAFQPFDPSRRDFLTRFLNRSKKVLPFSDPEEAKSFLNLRLSRRSIVAGAGLFIALLVPWLLPPRVVQAGAVSASSPRKDRKTAQIQEWEGLSHIPWQFPEWPPLSQEVAAAKSFHTLHEPGGTLDFYDSLSILVGEQTNFRQKAEDLANWYFATYPNLEQILRETSGFCHGLANASAYGEEEPIGDENIPLYIKLGILAALHSGDSMYKPGIEQLMEDLVSKGTPFVIETKRQDGFWSRVVLAVDRRRTMVKATDFGRAPKELSLDQVRNAYIPVPQGEEENFPAGTVQPAIVSPEMLERWSFPLNKKLVRHIVYGESLSEG